MIEQYFRSEGLLKARFDGAQRQMGFRATTLEAWRLWRQELRATLRQLTGLDRMTPVEPRPRVTETAQCDGYRRERVEIDTEPGVTMPVYVLIPDGLQDPAPAVIASHGHDSGGKISPAGVIDIPGVAERVRNYNYDYGVKAAQRGFVVFCPDARGFGERRESFSAGPDKLFNSSCAQLAHMGIPLGLTVIGMWTWDLQRLVDYAESRPECQGRKIGAIGLSGGGLQTLWLSALDDRIACAVVSGYFYGVKDSLLELSNNCDCNYVPHLWEKVDMGDLGALVAPRPLLIEAGLQDPLNGSRGIDNVKEQVDIARQAYGLLQSPGTIDLATFDGPHMWHGARAWAWLDTWLKG